MTPIISGKPLPPDARAVLFSILSSANIPACTVTSVARTAAEQAAAMYENLIGTGKDQGVGPQMKLYKEPGEEVIAVFVANRNLPADQCQQFMTDKINELGPSNVSHHCADPSVITVFDVAPSSIAADQHADFEAAVQADKRVTVFFSPRSFDPAYHLEVPRFTVEIPT